MRGTPHEEFTVGICAAGESEDLAGLAGRIAREGASLDPKMSKLVIVASGCSDTAISQVRNLQEKESRIELFVEDTRRGKADAINKILSRTDTPLVILVNSDSQPEPGALVGLLSSVSSDRLTGAVSAVPVPERRRGLTSMLAEFMWSAHNRCSITLNHLNLSNHSCDELVLFRSEAIGRLPVGLVNDGAFLAATARRKGYAVKVCAAAKVRVATPRRISDIVLQRRRILFGHAQVWRKVGSPPKTIESLLFLSPRAGARLLVATLAKEPRFVAILPVAVVSELSASLLSILDTLRSSTQHVIWRRFT